MVDPTSTAEKLASLNPAARAEGQRELAGQSSSEQQTTISQAKEITTRSGVTGVTTSATVEKETARVAAVTAAKEETVEVAGRLTGRETAGELVTRAREIATRHGVASEEIIGYLSEEVKKSKPTSPFETPYARIQREAKFTPAKPVQKEIKRVKGPPTISERMTHLLPEFKMEEFKDDPWIIKKTAEYITKPIYEAVRKEPIKVAAIYATGLVMPYLPLTRVAALFPKAAKVVKYGLPTAYVGVKGYEVAKAPTLKEKVAVVGRAAVTEILPAYVGVRTGVVTKPYVTARYRSVKYTGKLKIPTEVKRPTYMWRKEFPIPKEIEETFGIRGKFEPPELAVVGRRPTEMQLQLWPKRYEPVKPIKIEPPKPKIPKEQLRFKEEFRPVPITPQITIREIGIQPRKPTITIRPIEVVKPRVEITVGVVKPSKPTAWWKKPFIGKKAELIQIPKPRIEIPELPKRFIITPKVEPMVKPTTLIKPAEVIYPKVTVAAIPGMMFKEKVKVEAIPKLIIKPKIEAIPKVITMPKVEVIPKAKVIQKITPRQKQKLITTPTTVQIQILKPPTPFPPSQIPKPPVAPPHKPPMPPVAPPVIPILPSFLWPKFKRPTAVKEKPRPFFKQPTAYAPMLHAVVGGIKALPSFKKALKKKKLKFLPTGLEYRGL